MQIRNQTRSSSDIIGMDIQSATGEKIGEIRDMFIDMETGRIVAVVASTGRFLDAGDQNSLLSTDDLRFDGDKKHLRSDLQKEHLLTAPRYRKDDRAGFDHVRPLGESGKARYAASNSANNPGEGNPYARNFGVRGSTEPRTENPQVSNRWADQRGIEGSPDYRVASELALSTLVGMDVENRAGDSVGKVDKVYLDLEGGQVSGAVVSTGGFLGIGAHQNVLALNEFDYNAESKKLVVDMDRDQLRSAPTYKSDDTSWHVALRERSKRQTDRLETTRTSATTTPDRLTVFNQGNSRAETKMTADIRSAIRANSDMSSRANNVTIITQNERVLIRGDVDSATEKAAVEAIARGKAGALNVTSELVVRSR